MSKLSLDEMAALNLVLDASSVKDLLHYAMIGLAEDESISANSLADLYSQAISTFLS